MKNLKIRVQVCAMAMLCLSCSIFKKPVSKNQTPTASPTVSQPLKSGTDMASKSKPGKLKPYEEVITKHSVSQKGLFNVHVVDDRYFFEVPNALLDKDLLVVNRISKGAAGASSAMLGYAGDQVNENLIRFSRGPAQKLFIKNISYTEWASDSTENGMYRSVLNSGLQPIVAAFELKALSKDSSALVIDVTDYLNADNELLLFDPKIKTGLNLGGLQTDKSYLNAIKTYPGNVEIRSTKTYSRASMPTPSGTSTKGGNVTFEMNSSIILLPEKPMSPRLYDKRVGYFSTGYLDFDINPQGVKPVSMITRWRLEPRKEDESRYLRGELVEPIKPIVFYIDPATPKKWVPYLIQGINDWNAAFEAAGFKNAIIGKQAPSREQDSTWSIDDARHNVIVYKPSALANAQGPHVHDPRTGEILESHISWYHNVMHVLRNWYMVQAAAVDPRARKMTFDDELMGQLIRFVSSHELGHTLGLRHNFGSSSTVPVEKLRDKAWVEANGHTPSIMDYARFNYVAQPEDKISDRGIFPRIGEYDKWAIEWGYRWWPQMSGNAEESKLNHWVTDRNSANRRLWYGAESDVNDPRCQSEDLGNDAMKAGAYGIKNLQRIVPHLAEWTKESNGKYDNLKMMHGETVEQFKRYVGHVLKNLGGVMSLSEIYANVPVEVQKKAVNWLQLQVFKTPIWLLDKAIISKTGIDQVATISGIQFPVLERMLSAAVLNKLISAQVQFPESAYSPLAYLADVERGIWLEVANGERISVYRRNLQKNYLINLIKLAGLDGKSVNVAASLSDATAIGKSQLRQLSAKISAAVPKMEDQISRCHLQDCLDQIQRAFSIR